MFVASSEFVDAAIARIDAVNGELNAVIHPLYDRARSAAASAPAGPFTGVPIVLKDNFDTAEIARDIHELYEPLAEDSGLSLQVKDDLIHSVVAGDIDDAAAERIDLGGRTLMPGLIDCHVHLYRTLLPSSPVYLPSLMAAIASRTLRGMLMSGFTTVREAGSGQYTAFSLRRSSSRANSSSSIESQRRRLSRTSVSAW